MALSELRLSDGAGGIVALRLAPTPLGSGGDGSVYASISHPELVAKLYHEPGRAPERRRKLLAMLGTPPQLDPIHHDGHRYVQLTWPTHLVEDAEGRFRGYAMPRVELDRAVLAESLLSRKTRQAYQLPEAYRLRVAAAGNLAAVVEALHARGHHVVDLKPLNAYVYRDTFFVALLDCDGFSVQGASGERFPAHQYTPDYIAPEALLGKLAPEALGEAQDRFALATVVFQLLNGGVHPFQGVPAPGVPVPPSTTERMMRGMYAYGRRRNPLLRPSPWSIHESFDDATRDLFDRAFGSDPAARPDAGEWRLHLAHYADPSTGALRPCPANPDHALFAAGPSAKCLQCALDAQRGAAVQAARLRPAPAPAPAPAAVHPPAPRPVAPAPAPAQRSSADAWVIGGLVTAGAMGAMLLLANATSAPVAAGSDDTSSFTQESCPLVWPAYPPPGTIQALLDRGVARVPDSENIDVSHRDEWGRNAVHWSVRMGARVTQGLVASGAAVDLPDNDGVTPLMVAAGRADAWHVDFLLDKGADPDAVNAAGQTPLMHLAASCTFVLGKTDTISLAPEPALLRLLEAGVDIDAQDHRGHTALMHAIRGSGLRVRDLLVAGADPGLVNRDGSTALDIASYYPRSPDKSYIQALLENARNPEEWKRLSPEERKARLPSWHSFEIENERVDYPYPPGQMLVDSMFILPYRW